MFEIHFLDWHYFNFESFGATYLSRVVLGVLLILFSLLSTSLHLCWNVVMSWSVSINRALLSLFYDLHCQLIYMLVWFTFWMHMPVWFISTNWRLHCWIPSLSAVLFSSCSRSWYRGTVRTVTSSFPVSQASCRVSFSLCCSYAEVARILLTLISPICAWKSKTYRHRIVSA